MARICLITANHVSFQPRSLREADSLFEAGHDVRVVCRQTDPILTQYDVEIMQTRAWRLQSVDLNRNGQHRSMWLAESLRAKTYRRLFDAGVKADRVGIRGYVKGFDKLLTLAISEPADWFIAHTQGGLPIAAEAATRWHAKLGFDCEDLLAANGTDPADIVDLIQRRYLPRCDYVSVPSECLGDRLVEGYRMTHPIVLYNVPPSHLAQGMTPPKERRAKPSLRLHWFGQTIGEGRGIEEAVAALGVLAERPIELHLRGRLNAEFRRTIEALGRKHDISEKIFFHPVVGPGEVIITLDQFDVGLALERADHPNYSLAASNKLFGYLLAGLAVAATDTRGHREVMENIPSAGFLFEAGNPASLADGLQTWLGDRNALRVAQQASWEAARDRYCWDIEQKALLRILNVSKSEALAQTA